MRAPCQRGSNLLRVSGQGKVGLVGTDPASTGNSEGMLLVKQKDAGTDGITLYNSLGWSWGLFVDGNQRLRLYRSATHLGSFDWISGAYTSIPDIRLKENITPVVDVLQRLKDVQVVNYTFKSDGTHRPQLGYLAQNLRGHFPEFVVRPEVIEGKESAMTVNYTGMSAVAIKATQEQQAQIEKLAGQLGEQHELDTRDQQLLQRMEERIRQLEAR